MPASKQELRTAPADSVRCRPADVYFNLTYTNQSLGHYWGERWELYKLFYSQTLWMYQRSVTCASCHEATA